MAASRAAPATSTVQQSPSSLSINKQPVTADLDQHIREQQAASVAALRASEAKSKQEADEKHLAASNSSLDSKLNQWENKEGQRKHIRLLLSSLHNVLWSNSGWKSVGITDLMDANSIKKINRKAMLIVHPDKVRTDNQRTKTGEQAEKGQTRLSQR